jgi:hypothetical protein
VLSRILGWLGCWRETPEQAQLRKNRAAIRELNKMWEAADREPPDPEEEAKWQEFRQTMVAAGNLHPGEESPR